MAELIFPDWFDEKTTIAQDDYILMADSEDNNKIKKAKYSYLKWEQGDPWQDGQDGQDWQDWADWKDWKDWKNWKDGTDWASIVSWAFVWDDLVFTKDDSNTVTIENAKTTLQWPEWEEWPEWPEWPAWNWIESITSSKSWKITTVTITETNWDSESFTVSDWADWQWAGDVIWPNSSTDEDIVLFDWIDGKHIKGGTKKLSDLVQTSGNQTINGVKTFGSEPVLHSKTADATNDGTKPATEAQVYKKQDKIDSSNKLSADNVSNGTNNRVCVVASTAPSTPSEWDLWYDTANDVLKSYNGTSWDEAGWGGWGWIQSSWPTTVWYIWAWDETTYNNLATHVAWTIYHVYPD